MAKKSDNPEQPSEEQREAVEDTHPEHQEAPAIETRTSGYQRPSCPKCGSDSVGIAGGMKRCNQCGNSWL